MTRTVFGKWLWDARRSILGWTVAIAAVSGSYAAFWPLIDDPELQKLIENYPRAMLEALNYTDFTTALGYLNATVYSLLGAVLLLVYAVTAGTRLIAGDEEAGTLDLVLAHPVSRTSLALQRFGAFAVSVLVIVAVLGVAILAVGALVGIEDLTIASAAAMHLHLAAFGILLGAVPFAVGAATGRRALALGAGAAVGVVAYVMRGLIPQVEGMEWVADYSAFVWLNGSEPLRTGVDPGHLGIMLGVAAALVAVGTWCFTRRDVAA
jgi:ABC-2 type transport system permease protein